jgi:hypothetical protein
MTLARIRDLSDPTDVSHDMRFPTPYTRIWRIGNEPYTRIWRIGSMRFPRPYIRRIWKEEEAGRDSG